MYRATSRGHRSADNPDFLPHGVERRNITAVVTSANRNAAGCHAAALFLFFGAAACLQLRADAVDGSDRLTNLKTLSIEDLMQTKVTSVAKYPEKLQDAASAIQVISGEEIRRSGYTTIPDALRLADNLNVAQKNPHDWAISARGFNANVGDKLLVLMDGRSVYTPLFSGVFWNVQDYLLEDLDRIEVISGPGGTLWGANAVNGVINITTKSAKDTVGTLVEAGGGTEIRNVAGVRYGAALGPNSFFRIYGKYHSFEPGVLASGGTASNEWGQGQAGFRFDATPVPGDSLTLQGDFYSGNLDLQGGGTARMAGGNIVGHWSHRLANDAEIDVKAYYDRSHLLDPFAASPFQPAGNLIDDLDTYDVELQHRFWLGSRHQVVWGAGFRRTDDQIKQQAPNLGFFPAQLGRNLYSFFVQDEIALADDVFLTLGSKLEHNDYTGWETEPNVRLRWNVASGRTVWAAVSRAVRTPSRFDRDLAEPSIPPVLIQGSQDFSSETVLAGELGYRVQVGRRASASVSLFYNHYDDLRGLSPTPVTTLPLVYTNSVAGKTYGGELGCDFQLLPWWTLHAGYSRLVEKLHVKAGDTDFQNALGETADPANQFSLRSSMDLPKNFELDATFRWVDSLPVNNFNVAGTVPSYAELNVRIGWRPSPAWEFSLVGQNLLHAHHPEYGFPGNDREELQRGVYGKVVWRF